MALISTLTGVKLLVQLGDGGSPETFTHDCNLNAERGWQGTASTVDNAIPDCDDPTLPAQMTRVVDYTDITITGSGKVHSTTVSTWTDWFASGDPKNVKVKDKPASADYKILGPFVLTDLNVSAPGSKDLQQISVTMKQAGAVSVGVDS